MRKRIVVLAALAGSLMAALGLLAQGALAGAPLSCGDTVMTSVTLTQDLLNCPGNGLVVGADNITIDGAGHTISGNAVDLNSPPSQVGILNNGYENVTIKNVTVENFLDNGIELINGAARNKILRVTVRNNDDNGVRARAGSDHLLIARSTAASNALDGFRADDSDWVKMLWNTARGHSQDPFELGDVDDVPRNALIAWNRAIDNGPNGDDYDLAGSGHRIIGNKSIRGGDGFEFEDTFDSGLVKGNVVSEPRQSGFRFRDDATGSRFIANRLTGGGEHGMNVRGDENTFKRNIIKAYGWSGIHLVNAFGQVATGNVFSRNVVVGNGVNPAPDDGAGDLDSRDDGIHDDGVDNTIRTTTALKNADHGIQGNASTIDGGGNVAFGNGGVQCANVICFP